jgi:hypothetical protein
MKGFTPRQEKKTRVFRPSISPCRRRVPPLVPCSCFLGIVRTLWERIGSLVPRF